MKNIAITKAALLGGAAIFIGSFTSAQAQGCSSGCGSGSAYGCRPLTNSFEVRPSYQYYPDTRIEASQVERLIQLLTAWMKAEASQNYSRGGACGCSENNSRAASGRSCCGDKGNSCANGCEKAPATQSKGACSKCDKNPSGGSSDNFYFPDSK